MSQPDTIAALNDLLGLLVHSFPMYLKQIGWTARRTDPAAEVLSQVAVDQEYMSRRVAKAVAEFGGQFDDGEFPMEFTELNDLAADYLLQRAIEYQEQTIASIADCVERLRLAPAASPLAEESLGLAKGHLESLREAAGAAAV